MPQAYAAVQQPRVVQQAYGQQPQAYAAQSVVSTGSGFTSSMIQGLNQGGYSGKLTKEKCAALRDAFTRADTDNSGSLNHVELAQVMNSIGMPADPSQLQRLFSDYDTDNDGKISYSEFLATFQKPPQSEPPKNHEGSIGADGKWVDNTFPPNDNSVYNSPNPAADHVSDVRGHAAGGIQWKRASEICGQAQGKAALFKSVHPNDVAQGILGDCWFLAAVAGLAEFQGSIFHLFQDKKITPDGKYTINIFNPTTKRWESVTIDDFVPCVRGEPIMAKPQENEMWVLLLEKAFAKWFGSYCQIQGAYCMVAFMLLIDCGAPCKVFTQSVNGQPPFNEQTYSQVDAVLRDAKNRNSVGLAPKGQLPVHQVWEELKRADASNHLMAAWTSKDPKVAAGVGASGEAIGASGIVKGHAYSVISAKEVTRDDGQVARMLQVRNPWGANPAAEFKGTYSDKWPGWVQFPRMKKELMGEGDKLDGMFWMSFEDFVEYYSDCGIVPKEMDVPRMGQVDLLAGAPNPAGKHESRTFTAGRSVWAAAPGPTKTKRGKTTKKKGCC